MMAALAAGTASEWLKRRRSLTGWLIAGAAGFVPTIIFLSRFRRVDVLPILYAAPDFWRLLWRQAGEAMTLLILPLTIMLIVSLVTQIEDRSNGWKQVHATPQPLAAIFAAKLAIILVLVAQLLAAYAAAVYLGGVLPALLVPGLDAPSAAFPLRMFAVRASRFLADSLPIVAIQYGLALRFRTFLTPLGIGMALWILSIGTMNWSYNFLIPYSYAGLDYLRVEYGRRVPLPAEPAAIGAAAFVVFILAGYAVFACRKDKG